MPDLPLLTEGDIRLRVGTKSFDRGQRYFHDGMIFDARRQNRTLKAACHGSMPEPYDLHVTFDDGGIAEADCSCPVGAGGRCKHIAALLLTWLDDTDVFTEMATVAAALQDRSKDDLIQLIQQMIDRHPDLEDLVAMPPPGAAEPIKASTVERQLRRIFSHDLYEWGSARRVARDLQRLVQQGDAYARHGDWTSVMNLSLALIDQTMTHYELLHDEEGDVAIVINDVVSLLGRCLEHAEDPPIRQDAVRALYDVITWNIALGGFDIGYEAEGFLRERTTPNERAEVAGWVEQELDRLPTSDSWGRDWKQEQLGGLLLELQGGDIDDEAYLQICRTSGRVHDLVERLLTLDRLDDALAAAHDASDYELLTLIDLFLQHGHGDAIYTVVLDRLGDDTDRRLVAWLKDQARARDDAQLARQLAERLFWQRPSVEQYDDVLALSRTLGAEQEAREAIHERLRKEKAFATLTEIYLHDGEPEEALQLVQRPQAEWGWYGQRGALRLRVAEALETVQPEEALHLYLDAVTYLIEQRGRENYAEAARLLQRVRRIYQNRGKTDDWKLLIDEIREANPRLRALKDELQKAGL